MKEEPVMAISEEEVKRIANLAKFQVEDEEVLHFTNEFGNILNMINELQAVDTTNVNPMFWAVDFKNVMREDKVVETQTRDELFINAKTTSDGFIEVPSIIDTDGGEA
ncbi:Asp-tRNA(Asn)/Glu-tRNA(Gln) amidotransferase GatCAB subunit C [Aerococcus agrisoli]|jgi:aspartyl-tRNA(Asn)/glutamyl-tRNA(Gln) amidotransferase subunit C|uniref:Aspartyl/glutamyl-tRNA(Asn/Gln) amidotransferase subunit C n=2 Tax=Aerococcaceae TaxID=186827 RepID=A0A3N4GRC5_9LACT|nr:aspartyl/glutamyl-tRNA(Asn/Gln) amidotransferase subunit C [Aerococcus sp. 1KP-2016]RPA65519.1 Asp-tRNA(Asn)/Glu-tRNA(Gln) amidotransferase GatCAB subunit C [Aerococcus agrisoli]